MSVFKEKTAKAIDMGCFFYLPERNGKFRYSGVVTRTMIRKSQIPFLKKFKDYGYKAF